MEVKLAHLHVTLEDSNGQSIDMVYIIEHLNITQIAQQYYPIYEMGQAPPSHFAQGLNKTEFSGTGYLFHQGPTDPKKKLLPPKPLEKSPLKTEDELDMEHLDNIDIE